MRKVLLFLLALLLTLTGCITGLRQPSDGSEVDSVEPGFIVNVPERGGSYLGLEPGISSADEVISVMKESNLLDPERDPNPYIDVYSDDSIKYAFKLTLAVNYDAEFWFEGGSQVLTSIYFPVKNLSMGEVIAQYGEPDTVAFLVEREINGTCRFRMYYDEIQTVVYVGGWSAREARRETCQLTEKSEVFELRMLAESDYQEHAANMFTNWLLRDMFRYMVIYPWRGYGNLFDLYPD
jgi:hypothetical protein